MIMAIDPGNKESAYVILDRNLKPLIFGKVDNETLLNNMLIHSIETKTMVIEMVASYGMAVGAEVFETVYWIGRFYEKWLDYPNTNAHRIYRKDVKMNLCHSMKAKDGNIRQALIDRFGPVGVKKNPGWFYGVSKDVWSAIAVGVTYSDLYLKREAAV